MVNKQNMSKKLILGPGEHIVCPSCKQSFDRMSSDTGSKKFSHRAIVICSRCGDLAQYQEMIKAFVPLQPSQLPKMVKNGELDLEQSRFLSVASFMVKDEVKAGRIVNIPQLMARIQIAGN